MKHKNQLILSVLIIILTLFVCTNSLGATAIVDTDTLKLRKEASTDSTVLELLNYGEKLNIIEQSGDWVKVKTKGITGFVHKDYVKIGEDENTNEEIQNTQNIVENIIAQENTQAIENTITENITEMENNTTIEETDELVREVTILSDSNVSILPLINASKIANIKKDTKATVMDEVKGWLYIQTEEINGWVRSNIIEENNKEQNDDEINRAPVNNNQNEQPEQPQETEFGEKTMYVNYSSIYVRKGPDTKNEVVETLILNSEVTVIGESGDWYKVKVAGKEGYIAKRLLSNTKIETTSRSAEEREEKQNTNQNQQEVTTSSKGQEIVNYAKQYLGCKYVYGGSGPTTFDCSGFTMYVYKHFGVSLSHSARAQSKNGTYVAKENLQLGDLVFFKDYETMDGIGHCGIYIGDGNFIHASSGTGYCVKISTLLSGSYNKRYETARRLF